MSDVRPASVDDLPIVAELLDAFNREFDSPTPGPDVIHAHLARLAGAHDLAVLVAGRPIIGTAVVSFRPSVWETGPAALLEELYVRPPDRNRGVGAALVKAAMALAKDRESSTLEINVDEEDVDAQRFYRRHGFSEIQPETGGRAIYFQRSLEG